MKYLVIVGCFASLFACSPKLQTDADWKNKKWVLWELRGVPVQTSGTDKDAHIQFSASDKKYSGSGGCNRMNGSYTLGKKGKLSFAEPALTRMACPDMAFESSFLQTLKEIDRYTVLDNKLHLMKGNEVLMKLR